MKRLLLILTAAFTFLQVTDAQIRLKGVNQDLINPVLFDGARWPASWIESEDVELGYGVYHFRKSFELASKPESFVVNVSADNRYKMYVNGTLASIGPAKGDVFNWNFETVDIAQYLHDGKNVIAVLVWNGGEDRPVAIMSHDRTALLVQGNGEAEQVVNTDKTWSCLKSTAFSPAEVKVKGYYACGATDDFDSAAYPWGWEQTDFDDSAWGGCNEIVTAAIKGSRDYRHWRLVPRSVPVMESLPMRLSSVREAKGITVPEDFPKQQRDIRIPAHSNVKILLDNEVLTTGYPQLSFTGGKGAKIGISYAEALFENDNMSDRDKGNRDATDGKVFIGYTDTVTADGGADRTYEPLWWRTWRYIQLSVETGDEPLVLNDISAMSSMYPFELASSFEAAGHPEYQHFIEVGWRTARLCAHETYMDCPYYEQLQYFGDSRIQAMITHYNTRDPWMVKHLIEQGRQSLCPDGITQSRYPGHISQFIPTFSLYWICTAHDYWMMRGDEEYLKTLLPAFRGVISWFEPYLAEDHTLRNLPYWIFGDWSGMAHGTFPNDKDGRSALVDQLYILTLQAAADMEEHFGNKHIAADYAALEKTMREGFKAKYWDASKQMFANHCDWNSYSQHVNILAILSDTVTGKEASDLFMRVLGDKSILQCTVYYRYYLQMAMKKTGHGDLLLDTLQILEDQKAKGLTTIAEMPDPSRSDCHAWGSSMNIEFFRTVLGIDSAAPGFKRVVISPSLGKLTEAKGVMPHPDGEIAACYQLKNGRLKAEITLPEGVSGVFVWKGKTTALKPGHQLIKL